MLGWIGVGVAVLVAVVVLGFCAYELNWKTARLRRDLAGLQDLGARLTRVQADLQDAAARAQRLRAERAEPVPAGD